MQAIRAFNEQRAEIYWWLSGLFSRELSEKEVSQYRSPEIETFLAALAQNPGLETAVSHLQSVIRRLTGDSDAHLKLATSFQALFLTSGPCFAAPYASVYGDEGSQTRDRPTQEMTALMHKHGITIHDSLDEPADHLAVELDFLGQLIIRSNELEKPVHIELALNEQAEFIRVHLSAWVTQFAKRCRAHDPLGFYAAAAELLVAFLDLDLAYLADK